MRKRWIEFYNRSTLATKIRFSYLVLLVPIFSILFFSIYNLWSGNQRYEDMINSTLVASEFSLDFKKDFDYEIYLVIVGNKTLKESDVDPMLRHAKNVVKGLENITESQDNRDRLQDIRKYLDSLQVYVARIDENMAEGNLYEENMEIWENDVQIVTTLVRDEISQYTYYEIQGIQKSKDDYQKFYTWMLRFCLIALVGVVVAVGIMSYLIPLSITRPFKELSQVTDEIAKGNLSVRANVNTGVEATALSNSMNTMIDKINELLEQVTTEQIRLRKAEFELLQAQINPHFLYNTLDAIIWLAEAGEQKRVVGMVRNLSDFFRTSLNQGKDINSIKEEMLHVKSYLEIQHVRYQDILSYDIEVPEALYIYSIPKITIQPLVENALYHGIKNKRGMGHISIRGEAGEKDFTITVTDDGIGIDETRLRQVQSGIQNKVLTGKDFYGLYNVCERIRLNFGEEYGIFIESVYGEGTSVRVILPYVEAK
ncbi:sensor histidine kinase [Roseburia sp. AM51-8]|jgi:two-component system sensor histidine kinase YesM|uniref:Sensor histidine kinase n=1 Tax=Roseburia lenta TaxID=2763061 RepID=A0ABR7GG20_9FIRM|nr:MULTISPECIES: sensor histidine kinase [Roseburia]MBC5686232.1 sensor histidine kinase [Roseburia lenta]MDY3871768.1 sensor histidine kinase [Roseburia lenta]RHQ01132.1 sensor histidine kinase [Roseburia sp. AM51-8]